MNNKITMPALVAMLALKSGLTKEKSEEFLKEFFKLISDTLREGDSVKIKALGTFKIMSVDTRKSVNVTNGEEIVIPGHKRIVFVPSREIADEVNSPFSMFDSVELNPEAEEEIMESLLLSENVQTSETSGSTIFDSALEPNKEENIEKEEVVEKEEIPTEEFEGKDENKEIENKKDENTTVESQEIEEERTERNIEEENEPEEIPVVKVNDKEIEHSDSSIDSETKVEPINNTEEDNDQNDDKSSNMNSNIKSETANDHNSDSELNTDSETVIEEVSEKKGRGRIKFVMGFVCGLILAMLLAGAGYFFFLRKAIELKEPEKQEKKAVVDIPEVDSTLPVEDTSTNEIKDEVKDTVTIAETSNKEKTVVADTQPSDKVVKDVIGPHNYLTTMAQRHYGDFNLWAYIYEENKSFLGHPDRIKPGTEVVVPPLSKYGVDPKNPEDVKKAKRLGVEIYKRFNKPERIKK